MSGSTMDTTAWPHLNGGRLYDRDLERAALGSCLIRGEIPECVADLVMQGGFHVAAHRAVARALVRLRDRGEPADVAVLRSELAEAGDLDAAGGPEALATLLVGVPRSANLEHYAARLVELHRRRQMHAQAEALRDAIEAGDPPSRIDELLDGLRDPAMATHRALAFRVVDVDPDAPRFTVDGLIQTGGLHLWWAASNVGKSYLMLAAFARLLAPGAEGRGLFEHPELTIRRPYRRVLAVTAEEHTGRLRFRYDRVCRGLGVERSPNLVHVWTAQPGARVYLDDLPELVDEHEPDAVLIDPLTALLPRDKSDAWDLDNVAADDCAMALRGVCGERGVDVHLIHHANASGERERGASAWGNSADVKVRMTTESGRIRVEVQKQRDAAKLSAFLLEPEFTESSTSFEYAGDAAIADAALTPCGQAILSALRARGETPQHMLTSLTGNSRPTVSTNVQKLRKAGHVREVGKDRGSPVLVAVEPVSRGVV